MTFEKGRGSSEGLEHETFIRVDETECVVRGSEVYRCSILTPLRCELPEFHKLFLLQPLQDMASGRDV
jgi:hypothetical protein